MFDIILTMNSGYVKQIKGGVAKFDPRDENKYFLFGSFVKDKKYHDIDLGVVGNKKSRKDLSELRDLFYDSAIPYKVDVVDFDNADENFKQYVFKKEPILWIQ